MKERRERARVGGGGERNRRMRERRNEERWRKEEREKEEKGREKTEKEENKEEGELEEEIKHKIQYTAFNIMYSYCDSDKHSSNIIFIPFYNY